MAVLDQFLLFLGPFLRQDDFLPEPGFQMYIWMEDRRGRGEPLKAVSSSHDAQIKLPQVQWLGALLS